MIDLRGRGQAPSLQTAAERNLQVTQLARAEAQHPFDLVNGPLLRACLLRLTSREHVLLFTLHHIVTDGWSLEILSRELNELYSAFSEGRPATLSPLPIQYADYVLWQREWLKGEVLQEQLAYWRQKLAGAPTVLSLPTDRPRPAVQTSVGAVQTLVLPLRLLQELKQLSQSEGATLFMTLLAAFQILLMRYSGEFDVVVGSSIANRRQQELESLIGLFMTALVLRTDLSGNPTFLQLLARVREVALQAYVHQDIPFEKLLEELQPQRDLSRQPWFQVLFNLQNASASLLQLPGLDCRPVSVDNQTAKFDLSMMLTEDQAGLQIVVEYNTDLFDAATMQRLLGHWQTLLEAIVRDPRQSIETLPLLTEAEREQMLVQWNATMVGTRRDSGRGQAPLSGVGIWESVGAVACPCPGGA